VGSPESFSPWTVLDGGALGFLFVLCVVLCGGYLFGGGTRVPGVATGDAPTQWICWRDFGFSQIRGGSFPMWNPHVLCGVPFFAGWQSALLYPPNLLFAVLPLHWAARLILFGHMLVGAVAAYIFARYVQVSRLGSLAAGVTFSLSAPILLRIFAGHWGAVCALAWMPVILLAVEALIRRPTVGRALLGGLAVAMQLLSGAPQQAAYTWVLAGLYLILRMALPPGGHEEVRRLRPAARLLVLCALLFAFGAGLAGVQLVPALASLPLCARAGPLRSGWAELFSLPPMNLVTFLVPSFFGDGAARPYWGLLYEWEACAYVGCAGILLAGVGAVAGRRRLRWVLAGCAAATLLLALGKYIPPVYALYRLLPGTEMLRGSCKFLAPFALVASLLAGLGVDALARADRRLARRTAITCGAVAVLLFAGAWWLRANDAPWRRMFEVVVKKAERERQWADLSGVAAILRTRNLAALSAARSGAFLLVCLAAVLLHRRWPRRGGVTTAAILLGLVCLDMVSFAWAYLRPGLGGFDASLTSLDYDTAAFLRERSSTGRVWIKGPAGLNEPMRLGLHTPEGIEPNTPMIYSSLFNWAVRWPLDLPQSRFQITRPSSSSLWDLMGVRYYCIPKASSSVPEGMPLVYEGEGFRVYENPRAVARAFVAHVPVVGQYAPGDVERLNFAEVVLLDEPPSAEPPPGWPREAGAKGDRARIVRETPNGVEVEAELTSPGWLVLTDNYFPGWRAEANGAPAPIVRADWSFRAVHLGPGRHEVTFTYVPIGFHAGLVQSALAALAALFWLGRGISLRRRGRMTNDG
jgi:hypothetical protein